MSREKIEVIHAYSNLPALAARMVCKLRRSNTVLVYLESVAWGTTSLNWRQRLPVFFEILALKWCDHIIVQAPSLKSWLVSEFNLPPAKITQIFSGVAVDEIEEFMSQRTEPAHQSNTILCVGTVSSRKNQFAVVKAASKVITSHPEVKFVFAGPVAEDDYLESVNEFVAGNELSQWVDFTGEITKEELYELYGGATIFLFPSVAESQGLVLVEAMAFGCPVVASNIEPFKDVADREEGSAILVDPDNIDELAAAIIRVLEDSSLRQSMSQKAKRVGNYYSWEQVAARTLALYERLVQDKTESKTQK
jgi:glycosyltransferase involved in cell wall biosynthesis